MALKLRPTRLRLRDRQIDKERHDYTVYMGHWAHLRDPWRPCPPALVLVVRRSGSDERSDRVGTFEEAKAQFHKSWDAWKAWAKLEEAE